jgi:hypothetical protein
MLRLQAWRPINYPGDADPPIGPRPRIDFLVLAALLTDLLLFVLYVVPRLRTRETSTAGFIFFLAMLFIMWLGPFLGLLLRRGRGAALLSYGIAKLAIALATLGWWWGHGISGERPPLAPLVPSLAWHGFGVALAFLALLRRPIARPSPVSENL